jgi:hypothetical protein
LEKSRKYVGVGEGRVGDGKEMGLIYYVLGYC